MTPCHQRRRRKHRLHSAAPFRTRSLPFVTRGWGIRPWRIRKRPVGGVIFDAGRGNGRTLKGVRIDILAPQPCTSPFGSHSAPALPTATPLVRPSPVRTASSIRTLRMAVHRICLGRCDDWMESGIPCVIRRVRGGHTGGSKRGPWTAFLPAGPIVERPFFLSDVALAIFCVVPLLVFLIFSLWNGAHGGLHPFRLGGEEMKRLTRFHLWIHGRVSPRSGVCIGVRLMLGRNRTLGPHGRHIAT